MLMPLDIGWPRPNRDRLRRRLLLAVAELDVFTAALRHEIDRSDEEGSDRDRPGPADRPPRHR